MKLYVSILCLVAAASVAEGWLVRARKISKASNRFSQNLYQQIALAGSSSIYSSLSIHDALSMTSLGARGETATEILEVLGLIPALGSPEEAHQAYSDVIEQLNNVSSVEILSANAIFVNPKSAIESTFISNVTEYYQAEVSNFDLTGPPEKKINDYVEDKTKGLVTDLLAPASIDASTTLVLINTLFFNGTWQKTFPEARTRKADFHTPQGTVQVDTMFDTRFINLKRNYNGNDVGELVFNGGRFSLFIVLPKNTNGLPALEASLTIPGRIEGIFQGLTPVLLKISIPKFKIESTYELESPLRAMGIVKAFDPQQANFTGISRAGGIYISKVIHKAVIEVKETGTVAAAATAVIITRTSPQLPPNETFYVDHPFLYFIYDKQLELILFQGKYSP